MAYSALIQGDIPYALTFNLGVKNMSSSRRKIKIRKIGNSVGVILPSQILSVVSLSVGDEVDIYCKDSSIYIVNTDTNTSDIKLSDMSHDEILSQISELTSKVRSLEQVLKDRDLFKERIASLTDELLRLR